MTITVVPARGQNNPLIKSITLCKQAQIRVTNKYPINPITIVNNGINVPLFSMPKPQIKLSFIVAIVVVGAGVPNLYFIFLSLWEQLSISFVVISGTVVPDSNPLYPSFLSLSFSKNFKTPYCFIINGTPIPYPTPYSNPFTSISLSFSKSKS